MINLEKFSKFSIFCILVLLTSCTVTNMHSNANLEMINSVQDARTAIKIGMSMSEVQNMWGEPNDKRVSNEDVIWGYVHLVAKIGIMPSVAHRHKSVSITFVNSQVTRVDYIEQQMM